jgi:hypothetical protein
MMHDKRKMIVFIMRNPVISWARQTHQLTVTFEVTVSYITHPPPTGLDKPAQAMVVNDYRVLYDKLRSSIGEMHQPSQK